MPQLLELTLAYNRTVNDMDALARAWEGGKDFKIKNGPYTSIRDMPLLQKDYDTIVIRALDKTRSSVFSKVVFANVLASVTTYI